MEITIVHETQMFLTALLVGAGLAAVYDIFRILRIAVYTSRAAIIAEDLCYFIFFTIVTFMYILRDNSGSVRIYILFGQALGWVLYYLTIGSFVLSCSKTIIRVCKAWICFFYRLFIRPVLRFASFLYRLILRPFRFIWEKGRKVAVERKYSLKHTRIMLYNLLNRKI